MPLKVQEIQGKGIEFKATTGKKVSKKTQGNYNRKKVTAGKKRVGNYKNYKVTTGNAG